MLLIAIHDPQIPRPGLRTARAETGLPGHQAASPRPRFAPDAPGCLPRLRFGSSPARGFGFSAGGVLPGSSSLDGGIDEFDELRERRCSSLASFPANCSLASNRSATCVDSVVICPSWAVIRASRSARSLISSSRGISSGRVTQRSHYDQATASVTNMLRSSHFVPATTLFPGHARRDGEKTPTAAVVAAAKAASLIRQFSYPPSSSTRTSSRPARFRRAAAASTTSRDSDVSLIRPNGVTYGVDRDPSDALTRSLDVLTASTPNTSNVSGSANAATTARASLMAMSITIAATRRRPTDRPCRSRGSTHQPTSQRLNIYRVEVAAFRVSGRSDLGKREARESSAPDDSAILVADFQIREDQI